MDKKQQFYEDLYVAEKQSKPTQEQLATFINQKQSQIAQILGKENGSNLGLDDIIALREQLSLPEYIQLDEFNKLTQLYIGKDGSDTKRYDDLLKLPDHGKLLEVKTHQAPKVEKLIKYQGSKLAQGLVEIVANAIDASNPNQTVGRFGEGFYQALKFLENKNDILKVSTKAQGNKGFDVNFKQDDGIKIGTIHNNQLEQGTTVSLQKQFNEQILKQLSAFVTSRFKTNTYANVYLNGKLINDFGHTTVINGKKLEMTDKPSVYIKLHQQGFSVKDEGIGMNSKTIAEKLVYPTGSSKKKINPSEEALSKLVEKESKFFYTSRTGTNKESTVRLQVAGVVIEEFKTETVGKIDSFTLECPSFTWLPESRNQIIPERAVVLTIQRSLEKIQKQGGTLEEKIMLTEMIGKIINKLKQRKTDETEKKYTLEHIAKQAFTPLKEEIEKQGGIVLPGDKCLMNRLGTPEGVYYVSPDFVDLKIEKIPNINPLHNVIKDPRYINFLRKKSFFTLPFGKNAEHDYLITPQAILVNKTLLDKGDMQRQLLNVSINLNIGYELPEETVYYGRIENSTLYEQKMKKKELVEQERKALLNEEQRVQEEQELTERQRFAGLIKETVEKYGDFLLSEENNINQTLVDFKTNPEKIFDQEFGLGGGKRISKLQTPEMLLVSRIALHRPIQAAYEMNHKKYVSALSDFVLHNKSEITASLLQGIWGVFAQVDESALSANMVSTLIELYEKEPEYMMQVVERFGKQYGGKKGWKIFVKFFQTNAIVSKSKTEKEKYYEQEKKLQPFIDSFKQGKRPESELWDEMCNNWRDDTMNPGLDPISKDWNFFLTRGKKHIKQLDEILARSDVNLKSIDTELGQDPEYTIGDFKRKNKENQSEVTELFMYLDKHFTGLYTNILSDNGKESGLSGLSTYYSIEDCREEIFDYYNKKEYLKEQLQTNAQFRETLCEMIDISSIEIQDGGKGNDYKIAQEVTSQIIEYLLSYCDERISVNIINGLDSNNLENLLTQHDIITGMKDLFLSDLLSNIYMATIELYKMTKHQKNGFIFAGKQLYEKKGIMTSTEWSELTGKMLIRGLFQQTTIEQQKAKCILSYLHFKLFQQKKTEKETINETTEIVVFDNELEELKSKIPIYLDTTDSWLVDKLFGAYNIESDGRFKGWSTVLREQFPEFVPVTSMLEKGHLISLPTMIDQVNKNVFENLTDDDSLLFLEYIHQKIGGEEKKNEMFFDDLQNVIDIIIKFQELSSGKKDDPLVYNRNIYISIIQVYRNIYIKRQQAPISFPQEFEGTMFDEEYNEIFNIIMNSNEDDILKRDDLAKLGLGKLVADLGVLEGKNQLIDTTMGLKYLSKVYAAGLKTAVKSFMVLFDEYLHIQEGKSFFNNRERMFTNGMFTNKVFNGFLGYLEQKHSYIYTDVQTLLQDYKGLINVILAGVEYEKTIIESLKQLKEKKIAQSQGPTKESIIAKLSKTYPQDLIVFAQFLLEGGELLKEENSAIEMKGEFSRCKLSELIGMSRFMPQEIMSVQDKNQLDKLIQSFADNKNFSNSAFTRDIYSAIEGQDKSSMINIREKIQNGIDAIKKAKRNGDDVPTKMEVNFFAEQGNWVTQVQDPVGMNLHKVLNYLLIPGNSDKDGDDGQTGMFGQGFRSSAIGAKELRIKTSPGDGQLYQLTLLPIYNEDNNLDDFAISVSVSQENFKGTIIERVDDKSGIQANLRAMIGVHNMQKYVGNVESIDIMYGKQKINTPEKNIILQSTKVPGYGEMKLIKTSDNIVRWTKDNLYINEIPDDFLLDIPTRMKEYVESQNLTIDIPPSFGLTKSRNSLADYEEQLQTLRPHLFDMLINYILKEVVKSQIRIPMLPEDYFGLDVYERRQTESSRIAQRYSNGLQLTDSEIDYLKDKAHMAEFLVQIPFEWNGNTLSLLEMKRRRNDDNIRNMMNMEGGLFGRQFGYYADIANELNTQLDRAEREDRESIQVAEKLGIEKERVDTFVEFMNVRYRQITQQQFSGKTFDLQFSYRPSGESGMAIYRISGDNVIMSLNVDHIKEWISRYNEEYMLMKIDETITHELNHMLESPDKRGSHEKDLEHNDSFEKMQRALLTSFTRL